MNKEITPGQVFDYFTTVRPTGRFGKSWVCLCKCGKERTVPGCHLRLRKLQSCGCKNEEVKRPHFSATGKIMPAHKDISGKNFGYLTAIRYVGTANNKPENVWEYRCVCGKLINRRVSAVSRGDIKSCGCMKGKLISASHLLPNEASFENDVYYRHLKSAARRDIVNFLSKEEYLQIAHRPCHYCGGSSVKKMGRGKTFNINSVDRKNNEPYYKVENSLPACFVCQRMKQDYAYDTFFQQAFAIVKTHSGGNT